MSAQPIQFASEVNPSWVDGEAAFLEQLKAVVPFDSLVLGVIDPRAPRLDALLTATGIEAEVLEQWCAAGYRKDELLRDARRKGLAEGRTAEGQAGPPVPVSQHVMVHLLPISLGERRAWYLALARADKPYDEAEQQQAALVLRRLHAMFDYVAEPALGRVLLGGDGRLIHADPGTESLLLKEPAFLSDLSETLPALVQQRWPELADRATHDAALTLADRPRWIRFHRNRAVADLKEGHWYLELRPLDEDDIPPVGVVEDERVAQAVAYLTDHYAEAPTLSDVAEAVHTSPFHFHRLFVRYVGRSPKHYLLRMQLMIAKWLLRATRTSIGDIASATGFASHGHFTATFHRMVGVSPSQYRESA